MSDTAVDVLNRALALPAEERRELMLRLEESLDDDDPLPQDAEFYEELARRSAEAHAHPERLLDGEQVMRDLRERLRRKRQA